MLETETIVSTADSLHLTERFCCVAQGLLGEIQRFEICGDLKYAQNNVTTTKLCTFWTRFCQRSSRPSSSSPSRLMLLRPTPLAARTGLCRHRRQLRSFGKLKLGPELLNSIICIHVIPLVLVNVFAVMGSGSSKAPTRAANPPVDVYAAIVHAMLDAELAQDIAKALTQRAVAAKMALAGSR